MLRIDFRIRPGTVYVDVATGNHLRGKYIPSNGTDATKYVPGLEAIKGRKVETAAHRAFLRARGFTGEGADGL